MAVGALAAMSLAYASAWASAVSDLPQGKWIEVADSRLDSIARSPEGASRVRGITAFSGGAYDTKRHRLLIWGGGHGNYGGNEVYAFDVVNRRWAMLSQPSPVDRAVKERTSLYPDGQPRSRHTYNYIEYLPGADRLVSFGGSGPFPVGKGEFTRDLSEFDFTQGRWLTGRRQSVPSREVAGGRMIGAHARLDPVSGDVIMLMSTQSALLRYDPSKDTWRIGSRTGYVQVHGTAAIVPDQRRMYLFGAIQNGSSQAKSWDIDQLGGERDLAAQTLGDKSIESANGPGLEYHPPSGCLVAWNGGPGLMLFNPQRLEWSTISPRAGSAVAPGDAGKSGTYGRFRYDARLDLFVLVNSVEENVYLYRPDIAVNRCRDANPG